MDQVRRIQERLERSHQHVIAALGTQRGRVEKAFDEVKLAMLEQELALKGHLQDVRSEVRELSESVGDLVRVVAQHEERLQRLEGRDPAA